MLRLAKDGIEELSVDDTPSVPIRVVPPTVTTIASSVVTERYGVRSRPNLLVVALIILLHGALIFAMVQVRQTYVRAREAKLTVVNLTPPPPPPAAEASSPPSQPPVVAPPPIVHTPVPPVQVATTPDPVPVPTPVVAAMPSAAPVAPAPSFAPPAPSSVVQAGDLGTQMVAGKPPRYPIESRRKREQGTVVLTLTLGVDGAVERIAVSGSSGFARLDDAARDAVKKWRWKPTIRGGQPMRVRGVVEIPFVLRAGAD
jgi:periplasmic protein TonB